MGAQILHRIGFRAIVDEAHQVEKIERWQKKHVTAIDRCLGEFPEVGVFIQSPLLETPHKQNGNVYYGAVWVRMFSWSQHFHQLQCRNSSTYKTKRRA